MKPKKNKSRTAIEVNWADFENPISLQVHTEDCLFCIEMSEEQTEEVVAALLLVLGNYRKFKVKKLSQRK